MNCQHVLPDTKKIPRRSNINVHRRHCLAIWTIRRRLRVPIQGSWRVPCGDPFPIQKGHKAVLISKTQNQLFRRCDGVELKWNSNVDTGIGASHRLHIEFDVGIVVVADSRPTRLPTGVIKLDLFPSIPQCIIRRY